VAILGAIAAVSIVVVIVLATCDYPQSMGVFAHSRHSQMGEDAGGPPSAGMDQYAPIEHHHLRPHQAMAPCFSSFHFGMLAPS